MTTILVAGTYDTKDDELHYIAGIIRGQGGDVLSMDISVLGDPSRPTDYSKHDVADAGGHPNRQSAANIQGRVSAHRPA